MTTAKAPTSATDWDDLLIPPQARGNRITLNLNDELAAYVPRRPGAYLRISSDRFGLEAGVDRQHEDAEDTRSRLRWGPFAKVYKENDTSAFKKRKVVRPDGTIDWVVIRPQFRRLLNDLTAGVIDGVIFYDLDRLVRQPRDLEDLIDIVEYVKRPAIGATGGRMNLINDSDRHMARMMCVMALKSSEDTARRVARTHLAAAQEGRIQGRIAYGWIRKGPDKGKILPNEAEIVQRIYDDFLTGESGYSIATKLTRDGIKPPESTQWSSTMVRQILRNPRYAGMVHYGGKHRVDPTLDWDGWSRVLFDEEGHPLLGTWERIIDPKLWSQVQFELQRRRQKYGFPSDGPRPRVTRRYLLSGILTCGRCGRGLVGAKSKRGYRAYRCPPSANGGCCSTHISAETTEHAIDVAVTSFLEKLLSSPGPEAGEVPEQLTNLRAKLDHEAARKQDLMQRWANGTIQQTGLLEDDFFQLLASVNKRISSLREAIATAEGSPVLQPSSDELLSGWRQGTLHQRRALLRRYLHRIEVLPPLHPKGKNRPHHVVERLRPHWKTEEEITA